VSATWLGTATPWLEYYRGRPAAPAGDQRSFEQDKRRIAEMAPQWREQRRQRAEQAFEQWRADRQEHAARLFAEVNGEDWGFPPPAHFCATLWSTPER
jgi:hypothetical protein